MLSSLFLKQASNTVLSSNSQICTSLWTADLRRKGFVQSSRARPHCRKAGLCWSSSHCPGCRHHDTPQRQGKHEAAINQATFDVSFSRRIAVTMCSVFGFLGLEHVALAENGPLPSTCGSNDGDEGAVPPGVVSYTDPAGHFRLVRPCGWSTLARLPPESSVIGTFYNPEEPGVETLAVYRAPAPPGVEETQQLGTARDVAAGLAAIAPNGLLIDAKSLEHGGRSYLLAHVQFGGNIAGMFGCGVCVCVCVCGAGW
ncbi:hypothetical protein Vretimale_15000 [Volvox reticuliferus]|uniref:PsbP C-terminal domain-containing protein n=1 Tax=Volvox reticuliferus TaxID=1737510 RepID=A0A8J4GQ08_9CHLO|nr:hypothetical protein Vretifemale_16381 [Volvox reticuliferus]GIM11524.1 hypothetical protein Vretimale_15000 [Volvox reticuliferus]